MTYSLTLAALPESLSLKRSFGESKPYNESSNQT
jgi:hypothetical protein